MTPPKFWSKFRKAQRAVQLRTEQYEPNCWMPRRQRTNQSEKCGRPSEQEAWTTVKTRNVSTLGCQRDIQAKYVLNTQLWTVDNKQGWGNERLGQTLVIKHMGTTHTFGRTNFEERQLRATSGLHMSVASTCCRPHI